MKMSLINIDILYDDKWQDRTDCAASSRPYWDGTRTRDAMLSSTQSFQTDQQEILECFVGQ